MLPADRIVNRGERDLVCTGDSEMNAGSATCASEIHANRSTDGGRGSGLHFASARHFRGKGVVAKFRYQIADEHDRYGLSGA